MSFVTKKELKKQLKELGVEVKGNFARISNRIEADDKKTYYTPDRFSPLDTKKPTIHQQKASKQKEGWFETEEEAKSHFLEAQNIAKKRAVEINKELDDLKKRLSFDIGYTMEGDTHGIYEDYLYINIKVDPYTFNLKIEED